MAVRRAWEVREQGNATSWYQVCLVFTDGARVDALAVEFGGRVSIEDVRAQPAFSLADLTALADWIEGPLSEACGASTGAAEDIDAAQEAQGAEEPEKFEESEESQKSEEFEEFEEFEGVEACDDEAEYRVLRRARWGWPRGMEGRRLAAQEYRAAQGEGRDPVLAVMRATGRSRRRCLRLIARARDAGFLTPRHARR
ncbi:DUF6214 family protein [Streptomyces sp. NPDC001978]|uniref:DUF6214 family protein n=1 Tax=Streptomyces sp. NPDC001978 TaxID=3364627 RepID=UPI0036A5B74E